MEEKRHDWQEYLHTENSYETGWTHQSTTCIVALPLYARLTETLPVPSSDIVSMRLRLAACPESARCVTMWGMRRPAEASLVVGRGCEAARFKLGAGPLEGAGPCEVVGFGGQSETVSCPARGITQ